MEHPSQNALATLQADPAYARAGWVARGLLHAGFQAFFAGGSVRDLLLGRTPDDYDIATSATPGQVIALFTRLGRKTLSVGAHFGVVLVCDEPTEYSSESQQSAIEVATFRHDGAYRDGRRPDAVRFSLDPREDVLRRDFTINGMLLDVARFERDGDLNAAILDLVGGRADLATETIRAIGNPALRFEEDRLRMLRAIRFAARLRFSIEPQTFRAIQAHAPGVATVSCERIREELTRMLSEGGARRALELLDTSGLLQIILPEAVKMHGVEQPPEFHPEGDVWVHTMLLLERLEPGCSPTLAWGALLHDIGKPATFQPPQHPGDRIRFNGHVEVGVRIAEVILARLRFSREDTDQIIALIKNHMRFGDLTKMKRSTLTRFLRMPRFDEHLALHWLDCMACHQMLRAYDFAKREFEAAPIEDLRPALLVTGKDLIAAGYSPGPLFRQMLETAEDAQLESTIATREEGLALLRDRFGPKDGRRD
jgi:poly(A) polymerase